MTNDYRHKSTTIDYTKTMTKQIAGCCDAYMIRTPQHHRVRQSKEARDRVTSCFLGSGDDQDGRASQPRCLVTITESNGHLLCALMLMNRARVPCSSVDAHPHEVLCVVPYRPSTPHRWPSLQFCLDPHPPVLLGFPRLSIFTVHQFRGVIDAPIDAPTEVPIVSNPTSDCKIV